MKRRKLLGTFGGGVATLSGCLTTPDSGGGAPPAPDSSPPVNSGDLGEFDPETVSLLSEVGSRDGVSEAYKPHDVIVWNATADERRIRLRVLDRTAGTQVFRESTTVPPDEAIQLILLKPSKYYVQLWGSVISSGETLLVPCDFFDCNESATRIGVFASGDVRSSVSTFLHPCPGPDC